MKSNTISVYRISTPSLYLHSGHILYRLNVYSIHVPAAYSLYKHPILTLCTCSVYWHYILVIHFPYWHIPADLRYTRLYTSYCLQYTAFIPQDTSVYLPIVEVYILPMYYLVSSLVPAAVFGDPPHAAGQGTTPIF